MKFNYTFCLTRETWCVILYMKLNFLYLIIGQIYLHVNKNKEEFFSWKKREARWLKLRKYLRKYLSHRMKERL
nr:MAG TPA: hypothetical protein [Caudoviricetes sp.]